MSELDRFLVWCKQEQDSIWQQLELLESGKGGTYEVNGSSHTDTTAATIEQLKVKLAALDALLMNAEELP
jgi:hypothetical protein